MHRRRIESDTVDLDRELDGLVRRNADYLNVIRVERLVERLDERGPVPVRTERVSRLRERIELRLDDGTLCRLRLFRPLRALVGTIVSLRWDDDLSWVMETRTVAGERYMIYAWLVQIVADARATDAA
jgi:hypothetical protein